MFEKLLLAATITFSLNLFIGMSVPSPRQATTTAQFTTAPSTPHSVYLAKVLHDRPFLRSWFQ
ncbi:MAG: hypothetical protein H7Z11_20525 [Verrucomicrobia bacterium]|nr:hypothetical protein [Leptolyngbya sp. ES-bin-22]